MANKTFEIKPNGITSQIEGFKVVFSTIVLQRGFYNVFARNQIGDGYCDLEIISIGMLFVYMSIIW